MALSSNLMHLNDNFIHLYYLKMSQYVGFDLTPDSGTTLKKVLKFNLQPHMEEFESISLGASKVSRSIIA